MDDDVQGQFVRLIRQIAQLHGQGRYQQAIPLAMQACDLARGAFGEGTSPLAISLNNLAGLYQDIGNFAAAEPLYRQAVEIYRQDLGEEHPAFAESLNNLAVLHWDMGNYAAAEPLHRQALEIRRRSLGEEHPAFATSLNNLALLHQAMGNYAAALPLYRQALEIFRQVLGEEHPTFASSLNNLAGLNQAMGDYAAAEPLYRQALEIKRRVLGGEHPDVAISLNNLAGLYRTMGNYAAALPLYRRALDISRQVLGEEHPDVAQSVNNLAGLYQAMGNAAAAEPLYRQALEFKRRVLGEEHPDVGISLNNLAGLCLAKGDYAAAEPLYRQALEIFRQALGEEHPTFATSLNNLAMLHEATGNYAVAEPLLRQALEIRRRALGEEHPDVAVSLNNLALLCAATDRTSEAMTLIQRSAAIDDRMVGLVFSFGTESQRMAYIQTVQGNFHSFLSLVYQYLPYSRTAVRAAFDLVQRRKGIGADALAAQRDIVLGGRYPALAAKLSELTTMRRQIARKALAGPGPEGVATHRTLLAEWTARQEALEASLAQQIPEMNLEQKLHAADHMAVALALPVGAVLLEFVRFDPFDFKAVPARGEDPRKPPRYLAFVIGAGEPDTVGMIDLGEAEPIDQMIAAFRATVDAENDGRSAGSGTRMSAMASGTSRGACRRNLWARLFGRREPLPPADVAAGAPAMRPKDSVLSSMVDAGERLRTLVFDPLVGVLGGQTRLLLAPDGDLSRLPFEVLPLRDGRRLIEDYRISYLAVGRDVLRFGSTPTHPPGSDVVVANPDFNLSEEGGRDRTKLEPPQGRRSRDLDRGSWRFAPLPGTNVEGELIARALGVRPWLGRAALEAPLKNHSSPRILHLATHGFFLPNQEHGSNGGSQGRGEVVEPMGVSLDRLSGSGLENPLLRSGLALSGANTWLKNGILPGAAEDGLLTAEDVTGMDLLDTELVVLSACDTGLGEVQIGEGVFGLRRAFVLAGARTLVMSLWKVDDLATAILMTRFYENLLQRHRGRAAALREAQLYVRDVMVGDIRKRWLSKEMIQRLVAGDDSAREELEELAQQPDDHRPFTAPEYWGAFICQGDAEGAT